MKSKLGGGGKGLGAVTKRPLARSVTATAFLRIDAPNFLSKIPITYLRSIQFSHLFSGANMLP
jgi:hypothetical protein